MSGRLALHGCRAAPRPGRSSPVDAGRQVRRVHGMVNGIAKLLLQHAGLPLAARAGRGKLAAVSVTTKAKSTGVDSGRRTWPLTGMMGTDMPPFRIARALFSGCAPACAVLITGTASAQLASRLLPEPGNSGPTWRRQLARSGGGRGCPGPVCRGCPTGASGRCGPPPRWVRRSSTSRSRARL